MYAPYSYWGRGAVLGIYIDLYEQVQELSVYDSTAENELGSLTNLCGLKCEEN